MEGVVGEEGDVERWTGVHGVRETTFEVVFDLCRATGLACAWIPGYRDECHSVETVFGRVVYCQGSYKSYWNSISLIY